MSDNLNIGGIHKQRLARDWPACNFHNERVAASIAHWIKAESPDALIRIPVRRIMEAVCEVYKISVHEMVGPVRHRYLVAPRFHAIALAVDLRPDLSLTTIGRLFNRDHSTIINARNVWKTATIEGKGAHIKAVNAILFPDAEPMVG